MTLCEVCSARPVVVARARIECGVSGQKLARVGQSKRSRCGEEHRQNNPVCAFHGEGRPTRPNIYLAAAAEFCSCCTFRFIERLSHAGAAGCPRKNGRFDSLNRSPPSLRAHSFIAAPPGSRMHGSQPPTADCTPAQRVSTGLRTAIPGRWRTCV